MKSTRIKINGRERKIENRNFQRNREKHGQRKPMRVFFFAVNAYNLLTCIPISSIASLFPRSFCVSRSSFCDHWLAAASLSQVVRLSSLVSLPVRSTHLVHLLLPFLSCLGYEGVSQLARPSSHSSPKLQRPRAELQAKRSITTSSFSFRRTLRSTA